MIISSFEKSDSAAIQALFTKVFTDAENEAEGLLIGELVREMMETTAPEDIFGFVAKQQEILIGSIFFTRLWFDAPVSVFILSPVAVHTDYQSQGIGQQLIRFGLAQLRENAVDLVFTYGDPAFYSKVGFHWISDAVARAPLAMSQPEGWLCQSLDGSDIAPLAGNSRCVSALAKPLYW